MEWRYKTVHYAVKKDGLLGGSFLDEEEMESSLNECGEQGWELVSLLEVRDGVVAVFKQEKDLFKGGTVAELVPEKDDGPVAHQEMPSRSQYQLNKEEGKGIDDQSVSSVPFVERGGEDAEGGFAEIKIE